MRTIVAEFHKTAGKRLELFSLITIEEKGLDGQKYKSRSIYDVDLSRTYGYVYHESGCGGTPEVDVEGIYWASAGATVFEHPTRLVASLDKPPWKSKETLAIRSRNRTRRLKKLPKTFRLESGKDLLDWLERNAIEGETVWCSTCQDRLPDRDLCRHCWWCDTACGYSTPDERCKCKDRSECDDPNWVKPIPS
jgi:hypothetical protein